MNLDVVVNLDDNYLQHAMAMLCSLFENNKGHYITVHVLNKNLSEAAVVNLVSLSLRYNNRTIFYTVDEKLLEGVQFRQNQPLTMAAYYRLLISSILPKELEKVLYLDCDMVVMRDIGELYQIELDDYALAATLDSFPYTEQHRLQLHMEVGERVFCSGVMLVNLKYWRNHNVEPGLLEYAKRQRKEVFFHDQDVLNYYFKRKWFLLPPKWNHIVGNMRVIKGPHYRNFDLIAFVKEPVIYHYASLDIKPWYNAPTPEKRMYVKYLRLSQYKEIKFERLSLGKNVRLTYITLVYNIKRYVQKCLLACPSTATFAVMGR